MGVRVLAYWPHTIFTAKLFLFSKSLLFVSMVLNKKSVKPMWGV